MKNDIRTLLDFVLVERLREICEYRGVSIAGSRDEQRERVVRSLGGEVRGLVPLLVRAELVEFLATRGYAFVSGASREELERLLLMLCSGDPRALDEKPLGDGSAIRFERRSMRQASLPVPPPPPPPGAGSEKVFRSRVPRKRGLIYFVKNGDVWAAPSRHGNKKVAPHRVHEAGVVTDHLTYLYFIDGDGDVARKRRDGEPLAQAQAAQPATGPVSVFIVYAREDRRFLERLSSELGQYEGRGEIKAFFDGRINPGEVWEKTLMAELRRAEVVIALVSSDFLSSKFCMNVEWPVIRQRHADGECEVAPLLVRQCSFGRSPVGSHQIIRPNHLAVDDHPAPHDGAWVEVMRVLDGVFDRAFGRRGGGVR